MKKEYDFSGGVRGKFYRSDAELLLPVYIEPDSMEALKKLSEKKGVELSTIVNEWIRKDLAIVENHHKANSPFFVVCMTLTFTGAGGQSPLLNSKNPQKNY